MWLCGPGGVKEPGGHDRHAPVTGNPYAAQLVAICREVVAKKTETTAAKV
jgi:hypothetical protein